MTTLQGRGQGPIGSAQWMLDEQRHAAGLVAQEVEEFTFSATNEIEWLNEHMAEVFTRTRFDVAEVFKTPGKLRGKTPRTLRKRVLLDDRAPLTDVFAPQSQHQPSPAHNTPFFKKIAQIKIAEDAENVPQLDIQRQRFSVGAGKENTVDERDVDLETGSGAYNKRISSRPQTFPARNLQLSVNSKTDRAGSPARPRHFTRKDSEDTFVSAKETPTNKATEQLTTNNGRSPLRLHETTGVAGVNQESPLGKTREASPTQGDGEHQMLQDIAEDQEPAEIVEQLELSSSVQHLENTMENTPSENASPTRTVVRKSSLNFASLPARAPMMAKKSFGGAVPKAALLGHRQSTFWREENKMDEDLARVPGLALSSENYTVEDKGLHDPIGTGLRGQGETDRRTTTQKLHERMAMLRQSTQQTLSAAASASVPRTVIEKNLELVSQDREDNDDDWIGPIAGSMGESKSSDPPAPGMLVNAVLPGRLDHVDEMSKLEADIFAIPASPQKLITRKQVAQNGSTNKNTGLLPKSTLATYPSLNSLAIESNTPAGSPSGKKHGEGPLSASKAKLMSVFKSAKGIFASSAGVSAQAKMETLSSSHSLRSRNESQLTLASTMSTMSSRTEVAPASLYPTINISSGRTAEDEKPLNSIEQAPQDQKTRRYSARLANMSIVDNNHDSMAKMEYVLPVETQQTQETVKSDDSTSQRGEEEQVDITMTQPSRARPSGLQIAKAEPRRPLRPGKDVGPKSKPAPVSIRVASQRIGQAGPSNTSLAAALPEILAGPAPARRPGVVKKASNSSLQTTSSSQTFKSTVSSQAPRPRALDQAARKKEQDEREVQRKLEQKQELERKRAAKAEEEKRLAMEQKAIEQQRLAEAKAAAAKQAVEQKKTEEMRLEQQRLQAGSRAQTAPHMNTAKPAKRVLQDTHDDERSQQVQDQIAMPPPSKRRRTSEVEHADTLSRSTAGPPMRLSSMRKEATSKFSHNVTSGTAHAAPSMLKSVTNAQHALHHPRTPLLNELAKYSNAKIPFADASNPPAASALQAPPHIQRAQPPSGKTTAGAAAAAHKSSPQYPNGDSIELPEIATDSDDSDDDDDAGNDFVPPDWAASPALRELLRQQQLVDPLKVFGPIAPLMMDEVFKGGSKERQARFRARTSSANWNGPDRLTEEERRRDFEARERLERNGGWTFGGAGAC